jgi:hypothetical protein
MTTRTVSRSESALSRAEALSMRAMPLSSADTVPLAETLARLGVSERQTTTAPATMSST